MLPRVQVGEPQLQTVAAVRHQKRPGPTQDVLPLPAPKPGQGRVLKLARAVHELSEYRCPQYVALLLQREPPAELSEELQQGAAHVQPFALPLHQHRLLARVLAATAVESPMRPVLRLQLREPWVELPPPPVSHLAAQRPRLLPLKRRERTKELPVSLRTKK